MITSADSVAVQSFEFTSLNIEVQKPSKEQMQKQGVKIELSAGSGDADQTLEVQIPYDAVFEQSEAILIVASYSRSTASQ